MKTFDITKKIKSADEYTGLYNWSERTAVFFREKKQKHQFRILDSMIDLMCMAATAISLVNCI